MPNVPKETALRTKEVKCSVTANAMNATLYVVSRMICDDKVRKVCMELQ